MFVFYLSFFLFFVMFRDPPNSTLTYPLFPSPTLFRSPVGELAPCARPNPAGTAGYEASNRRMGAGGRMKAQFLPVAAKRAIYVQKTCARLKPGRSEEHTSELQSLMRISYAVFCLTKKNQQLYRDNTMKINRPTNN